MLRINPPSENVASATSLRLKPLSLIPRNAAEGMRHVNVRSASSSYSPREHPPP